MDRTIARERSRSRVLMTYIVTGVVFMLLPGTFLGAWNLIKISSREAAGIHFARVDSSARSRATVRVGRNVYFRNRFLLDSQVAKAQAVCSLGSMDVLGPLDFWCAHPLVLEHLSMALAHPHALISGHGTGCISPFLSCCFESSLVVP